MGLGEEASLLHSAYLDMILCIVGKPKFTQICGWKGQDLMAFQMAVENLL